MKLKILIVTLFVTVQITQGQKVLTKNGHVWFYGKTPLEEIEAHNRQVVSIIDESTGEINFMLLIKSFEFKRALMQEHFNENYIESDKYPKSTFKGKITNLDKIDFKKDGVYPAEVSGDLTLHNVTKPVTAKGTIEIKGSSVMAKAKFVTTPHDFDIAIPSVVEDKIAKEIDVNVDVTYAPN
jgi:polyisoprenoid-binding protein YceI